jgi:hypothetical protein
MFKHLGGFSDGGWWEQGRWRRRDGPGGTPLLGLADIGNGGWRWGGNGNRHITKSSEAKLGVSGEGCRRNRIRESLGDIGEVEDRGGGDPGGADRLTTRTGMGERRQTAWGR